MNLKRLFRRHIRMKNLSLISSSRGFTLPEVLVGVLLLAIVSLTVASFSTSVLRRAGTETKVSSASMELKSALSLLSSELRSSATISPYLMGSTPSTVTCGSAFAVTSTTVKFLAVEDDSAASTSGLAPYYIGYKYDSATNQLLRGEIVGPTTTACTLPSGDPTSVTYAKVVARDVTQIDADHNGTLDNVFVLNGNLLTINLGIKLNSSGTSTVTFGPQTQIYVRTH